MMMMGLTIILKAKILYTKQAKQKLSRQTISFNDMYQGGMKNVKTLGYTSIAILHYQLFL